MEIIFKTDYSFSNPMIEYWKNNYFEIEFGFELNFIDVKEEITIDTLDEFIDYIHELDEFDASCFAVSLTVSLLKYPNVNVSFKNAKILEDIFCNDILNTVLDNNYITDIFYKIHPILVQLESDYHDTNILDELRYMYDSCIESIQDIFNENRNIINKKIENFYYTLGVYINSCISNQCDTDIKKNVYDKNKKLVYSLTKFPGFYHYEFPNGIH